MKINYVDIEKDRQLYFYLGKSGFWIALQLGGIDFEIHVARVPPTTVRDES